MGKKQAGKQGKNGTAQSRKPEYSDRKNPQVFDRLGKLIYQEMSNRAVCNSLAGLFQTDFPPETVVRFGATESIRERNGKLEKQESDFVLLAGTREFALEFQSSDDKTMGGRMFRYGYAQSERHKPEVSETGTQTFFDFPEGAVIYLEPTKNTPEKLEITLRVSGAEAGTYMVRVYKLLEKTLSEVEADKLYLLLPFYLMKYRQEIQNGNPSDERRQELAQATQFLAEEIETILDCGVSKNVITEQDKIILLEKTVFLYEELYGGIAEFKEDMMRFEEKFKSKIPEREAELIKQRDAKILGLFRQGKTVEEVEKLLAQESTSSEPQLAMT